MINEHGFQFYSPTRRKEIFFSDIVFKICSYKFMKKKEILNLVDSKSAAYLVIRVENRRRHEICTCRE